MTTLVPVLLAGGSGTRLWPTSRKSYPKQFVDLIGSGDSLLQSSLKRSLVMVDAAPWIIITGEEYRFLVAQQANETGIQIGSILLEPVSRNTGPAIALAAFEALESHNSPKLLIQTADHHIQDLDAFESAVNDALKLEVPFVLFGIKPTYPETGYGYIECDTAEGVAVSLVKSFKEKPDPTTAKSYVKAGNYLWNSGMFMLDAKSYLEALQQLEPAMFEACQRAYKNASRDLDFKRVDSVAFSASPTISIDYAVLERIENLHVLPYRGDWSDVGSWDSVASLANSDTNGNRTQGDALLIDCQNTFIRTESRLVAAIGLENLIIIETRDAIMIANRTKTQSVKKLVDLLKSRDRKEATEHRKMHRPWGSFETLLTSERFQVKQIAVNPGASLSLQMHHHRAEHWIVVSGTAEVHIDDSIQMLTENQSAYIPVGSKHRLKNLGKLPLTIIEVQSGSYLGEDDIIRLSDDFGRHLQGEQPNDVSDFKT